MSSKKTTNLNLNKWDEKDPLKSFRAELNDNLDKLDTVASELSTGMTQKVEKTYVDDEIEVITTQLAEKAKKVEIGTLTELKTTTKTNTVLAINESFDRQSMDIKQYLQKIRNEHIGKLSKVAFPTEFTWRDAPIQILSDGKNYVTYFDVAKFKNTGGITYYVDSVNGKPINDGLTEATAFNTLKLALTAANDGDTITILDTMLNRQSINGDNIVITKNINIIGKTKAVLKSADKSTFVKTGGYTNVYEVTRSNVIRTVDYKKKYEFVKVNTIAEVEATPGTYYTDNVKVYLHTLESTAPSDDTHFPLVAIGQFFKIDASLRDVSVYFENVEIVGGNCPLETVNSATTKPRLFMKNSGLYYNYSTTKGAPYVAGCDLAIFQNVETAYGYEDGFDYHSLNGVPSKFIEIDCKGHSNGRRDVAENFNGSTAHQDCKGIRIGGYYYNNIGPNIADVQGVIQTVNYEVTSFDSAALTWVNSAFQVYDNKQWLFNCKTFGCQYDIYVGSGGTMYVDNKTVYFSKLGSGTFVIES